jgi:hypothetical protein
MSNFRPDKQRQLPPIAPGGWTDEDLDKFMGCDYSTEETCPESQLLLQLAGELVAARIEWVGKSTRTVWGRPKPIHREGAAHAWEINVRQGRLGEQLVCR